VGSTTFLPKNSHRHKREDEALGGEVVGEDYIPLGNNGGCFPIIAKIKEVSLEVGIIITP